MPFIPKPPPKKLGYCIVGLGKFAVGQMLPALVKCHHARAVALVSGDPEKAEAVTVHYGISRRKIDSYANYDEIRSNPDIDIVYSSQRSSC